MPIVGQNFWQDAGNFGQGVGQTLGQAMLQQPMERYRLAMQQAQMAQQNNLNMLYAQQAAQQQQGLQQYRQQSLGQGQQQLDETKRYDTMVGSNNDVRNELASQRIQIQELTSLLKGMQGGVVAGPQGGAVPNVGLGQGTPNIGGGQPQQLQQPQGTNNVPATNPFDGFSFQTPPPKGQITQNQQQNFDLRKLVTLAGLMQSTNPAVQGLTNQLLGLGGQRTQQPQQFQQQGQGTNNPSLRQRPDGSFDFLGQ